MQCPRGHNGSQKPTSVRSSAVSYHRAMTSQIQQQITNAFPSVADELSTLSTREGSDSRWMAELGSHAVASFEAGHLEEVRNARSG